MNEPLADRVIAIAETRELDIFAGLLERRGARVLRYPLIQIIDAPDPSPVLAFIDRVVRGELDELILLTGEGLRRMLACIDRHRPELRTPFITALSRIRKITRGPKPARALRELGLTAELPAAAPTTTGVIETLKTLELGGRRVGVQLYGEDPNRPLIDFLQHAGALPQCVAPYRYADSVSSAAVQDLLNRMRAGGVDAIAFTSKAQVERLFRAGSADEVRSALSATRVAAVGPVVAEALSAHGVQVGTMPEDAWFMKPLTTALSDVLSHSED